MIDVTKDFLKKLHDGKLTPEQLPAFMPGREWEAQKKNDFLNRLRDQLPERSA